MYLYIILLPFYHSIQSVMLTPHPLQQYFRDNICTWLGLNKRLTTSEKKILKKKKKRQETGIIVFHFLTQQYFPTVWKDGLPLRNWAKHYLHQLWYSSTTTGLLNSSAKVWNKYVLWPFGWSVFLKQCFAPFPFLPPSTAPLLISHSILSINYIEWEETDMKCQQNFTFPKPANHNLLLCKNTNPFHKTPGIYGTMPKSLLGPVLTNSLCDQL